MIFWLFLLRTVCQNIDLNAAERTSRLCFLWLEQKNKNNQFFVTDGWDRLTDMRLTTVLVAALLVATCGNNDARTTDDGGKQKFLWKTGLMQFWKRTLLIIINILVRFIEVSQLTFLGITLKYSYVWRWNWSWNYMLNVSNYSEELEKNLLFNDVPVQLFSYFRILCLTGHFVKNKLRV
jgi:hypothetical protein